MKMFHMFIRIMEWNGIEILQESKKNIFSFFFFFFFFKSSEKESKLKEMFHKFMRIMEWNGMEMKFYRRVRKKGFEFANEKND